MPIRFRFDEDRSVAAVVYLASQQIDALDKYKLAKLLFLADKFHLVRYGRPITGDEYFALPYGPVPSAILNLLSRESGEGGTPLSGHLEVDRRFAHPRFSGRSGVPLTLDALSKSDLKALSEVVRRYGRKSFDELKMITHGMPSYEKAWANRGSDRRARMNFEEFFEEDSDAIEGMLDLMIEDAEFF
jgi:uncharacterized phage-associated protein